jgi:phosphoribosylaminoimidazolecarboxamide formyltransferase/IMP cyclohydrolase
VLARGLQTIGIGAGQMSRVDAVRIALEKATSSGTSSRARARSMRSSRSGRPELALASGVARSSSPALRRDAE